LRSQRLSLPADGTSSKLCQRLSTMVRIISPCYATLLLQRRCCRAVSVAFDFIPIGAMRRC
jgi:hypothetical protein